TYAFSAEVSLPTPDRQLPPGCLDVQRVERIGEDESSRTETWCPGQGTVATNGTIDGLPPTPVPDRAPAREWDPGSWEPESMDLAASPPLAWGTSLPVAGDEEVLVLAHDATGDVIFAS